MQKVVPAIIPESFAKLASVLETLALFSHEAQIDIVDGKFVPFLSWPYGEDDAVTDVAAFAQRFVLEFDLMVMDPEVVIKDYVAAGAKGIIIHLESTQHMEAIYAHHEAHGYQLGLSILNDTPLETLTSQVHRADFVQLMGIADIGSQGQPFDERVLPRIRELRSQFPALLISIDGGVTKETLPRLFEAGADRFISGSAILKAEDPGAMFRMLEALAR